MNAAIDIKQVYLLAFGIVAGVALLAGGVALWAHRQNQQSASNRSRLTRH